jgi:hypothetical protein
MAFKSKYTGKQIENLLDSVNNGEIGGATLTENDIAGMGFTKNTGTITAIQANGTTVASSGTANIPAATTSAYGVTKLSTSTSSTSTSLAATASAVKSAYDLANGKQDKLVSGTNIKTINGQSLLGSGDITVQGGGSSGSGSSVYTEVNHGTSDTTFELTPNTFHIWDEVTAMNLTLGAETSGIANEYIFQFASGSIPTTLTLPDNIKFSEDLVIEANKIYQISILKGLGSVLEWDNVVSIFPVTLSYTENNSQLGTRVYNELASIIGTGSGVLNDGDLTFILSNQSIIVTNVFYILSPYEGYVLYDNGMEYYILQSGGQIRYYLYD